LVLEFTKSWKSHCRARFCIPRERWEKPNVESEYRLNLKNLTGERSGPISYYRRKLEQFTLLESKHLLHDWGLALQGSLFGVSTCYHPTHIAIDDRFENAGSSFDLGEYKDHKEAHKNWETLTLFRFTGHFKHSQDGDTECSCCPEPERPTYLTKTRTPRLLSEVLASIAEVEQID
ncbi:hypothetical protein BGZ57DRAFT_710906, partial [Hyaloscypha finlandica]